DLGGERRICRAEANLNQQRAGQSLHMEAFLKAFEQPGLRLRSWRVGLEAGELVLEWSFESRRLINLELGNYTPGKLIAAKDVGQRLQLQRRGKDGCGDSGLGCLDPECRSRSGAQSDSGASFVLVGSDEAIEQAGMQATGRRRCRGRPNGGEAAPTRDRAAI